MKKTILTFGLISGVLSSVMMCGTVPFLRDLNHGNKGYYIGYTAIVLSFLLVFFGIRSYRDNLANGAITFGRAFTIGIGITLISCVFYVVTWEIIYFNFLHGFMDSYFAHQIQKVQSTRTPEAIQAKVAPSPFIAALRELSSTPSTPSQTLPRRPRHHPDLRRILRKKPQSPLLH
jgi:hypothetical protein